MKFTGIYKMVIVQLLFENRITGCGKGENCFKMMENNITAAYNMDIIRKMLDDDGQDIDEKQAMGYTALMMGVVSGHDELVDFLLERKADANIANDAGNTPLIMAVKLHRKKMIGMLLAYGADPDIQGYDGFTALMLAVKDNEMSVVSELLKNGADIRPVNKYGKSAMGIAEMYENNEMVRLLKEKK